MPSVKLYSEVNRLKAWVKRLKHSVQLRDERIEVLTAEGLGLQESLTVAGEQRDEAREELDEALERIHTLEEGMTATGLGLTNDLAAAKKKYARLRAHIRGRLRECRQSLWDYYVFREDYGRRHNGCYGPLVHLRELPLQIEMLENILAYR